jgi:hypothetical protein
MSRAQDLTLFVFMDALGWGLVKKHGFLADLLPYRQPVESVLGYSSTCVPTILTGRMPREHGHMAFFAYDPAKYPSGGRRAWRGCLRRWRGERACGG